MYNEIIKGTKNADAELGIRKKGEDNRMVVQIVGKQDISFDTKDGSRIEGKNLFCLAPNPNIEGLEAMKLFVPKEIEIPKGLELNKKIHIDFNHKGKIEAISIN